MLKKLLNSWMDSTFKVDIWLFSIIQPVKIDQSINQTNNQAANRRKNRSSKWNFSLGLKGTRMIDWWMIDDLFIDSLIDWFVDWFISLSKLDSVNNSMIHAIHAVIMHGSYVANHQSDRCLSFSVDCRLNQSECRVAPRVNQRAQWIAPSHLVDVEARFHRCISAHTSILIYIYIDNRAIDSISFISSMSRRGIAPDSDWQPLASRWQTRHLGLLGIETTNQQTTNPSVSNADD